jgi:signal transduction histidine kinase
VRIGCRTVSERHSQLGPATVLALNCWGGVISAEARSLRAGPSAVTADVPADLRRFSPDREIAAFRVVQESLTNVQRHSGSRTVIVRVRKSSSRVCVEISDQGKGMPSELALAPGVGISRMRERVRQLGGLLSLHSDGNGTTVTRNCRSDGLQPAFNQAKDHILSCEAHAPSRRKTVVRTVPRVLWTLATLGLC